MTQIVRSWRSVGSPQASRSRDVHRPRWWAFALSMMVTLPVSAHPGEPSRPAPLIDTTTNAAIDINAVAAESDQKARDDYTVLKLAASHLPNERHRIDAAWAAANGRWRDAARMFRLASRYADKYSQHRLSMLYWHGVGVERDRVEAYVWADLAAERGYPQFLAIRERMWAELSPTEQAAVPARGDALYREYGDPVAKRRFADVLAQAKRKITGSHTGFVGTLGVAVFTKNGLLPNLFENEAVASIYKPARIDPERYWTIEDRIWKDVTVTVGDLQSTSAQPASSKPVSSDTQP
jgi:uncharacterized protein